eukprot:TRINITY_DN14162_c0_g1_i2.p1 TRINITY_DN14162_c0_g1~~TRINITY_DN14162_c0_g1_i2.p1  ORF type:complete len:324 (+),score=63.23 TRINITY_DN14162_c0_g1_i2:140-1111(+)
MAFFYGSLKIFLVFTCVSHSVDAASAAPACRRFSDIYADGRDIATKMWGGAFTYETDEAKAYTMWFFDKQNPNDKVSQAFGHITSDHSECHLSYYHKDFPGPEPDNFTECHPWKDNACCAHKTVMSANALNEAYGAEYHWDRCGPLSQECERFFVQESCFYECDPNAGYYRKHAPGTYDARCDKYAPGYNSTYSKENNCVHNEWEMHGMPIKASYWDAMFDACRNDLFCGDGNFFSCAAKYEAVDLKAEKDRLEAELADAKEQAGLSIGIIILIVAISVALLCACAFMYFMVSRERRGKPIFGRLLETGTHQGGSAVLGATSM